MTSTHFPPPSIPSFDTPRLRLRALTQNDFEPFAGFYADPISATYGGPCGRDDAWRKFAVFVGHWALRGFGPWALELRSTGEVVGLSGLWFPEGWIEPEITWAVMPGRQGQGYATEGARRALQAAYEHFGWTTAVSVVAQSNTASIAVAERLGAKLEKTMPFRGDVGLVFRHQRTLGG